MQAVRPPDWWLPLAKWTCNALREPIEKRGWIVAILGRQLPLREGVDCENCDEWDIFDIWEMMRHRVTTIIDHKIDGAPIDQGIADATVAIRDRVIAIVSGQVLRASGARISHRLSWEHTAIDCVRELEANPRLKPLTEFRHLVVRFGCAVAVHIHREASREGESLSKSLFFDATAKEGFHRDQRQDGKIVGNNSAFAARILQKLLGDQRGLRSDSMLIKEGIAEAIQDCQALHGLGYGQTFSEVEPIRIEHSAPEMVFKPENEDEDDE